MGKRTPHPPKDRSGRSLRKGNVVRIIGVPDLSRMHPESQAESLPVFQYLVGKYKPIDGFDKFGCAEINFKMYAKNEITRHTVWIEPFLLHRRRTNAR